MVGSGIVALPWAFGESGFILGLMISVVSVIVSYRTCILMIRVAGNDDEYFDTLYKYWGRWAYYCGFLSTLLIMIAAVTSYFINLSQMIYYITLALLDWIFRLDILPVTTAKFDVYS
jgi:amino acid permease